jgi:hypothetical protein
MDQRQTLEATNSYRPTDVFDFTDEPSARGYNWATLFLEDIITGTWPSRLESDMRELNMVVGSAGLGPEND